MSYSSNLSNNCTPWRNGNGFLSVLFCLTCLIKLPVQAQHFTISLPKEKIRNSLYNRIGLYDSRTDTLILGMVQTSVYGSASYVHAMPPLYEQLQSVVDAYSDSSSGNAELLFHLREFNFSEQTGTASEKGKCLLRAALYVRHARGIYQRLDVLDTLITVKKTIDVTNALLKTTGATLGKFIAQNLIKKPADTTIYTTADIKYFESREKSRILLYTRDTLVDGLYTTYQSFARQTPDAPVEVQMESGQIRSAKTVDRNGVSTKISNEAYAFVYKGNAYFIAGTGYQLLKKKKGDYYFLEKWKKPPTEKHMTNSIINYGFSSGFFVANESAYYEMKIDYLSGYVIRGKLIEPR